MLDILEAVYRETEDSFSKLTLYSNQVYRAIVYVNENFEDSFTEEEVAPKFGMSYGYFSRSFKAATGKNFRDYVMAVRINHAEYLIINSDLPISHIATKCGYSNVSRFIQLYKRLKGATPLHAGVLREPTIASLRSRNKETSPSAYSFSGLSGSSCHAEGYSGESLSISVSLFFKSTSIA